MQRKVSLEELQENTSLLASAKSGIQTEVRRKKSARLKTQRSKRLLVQFEDFKRKDKKNIREYSTPQAKKSKIMTMNTSRSKNLRIKRKVGMFYTPRSKKNFF